MAELSYGICALEKDCVMLRERKSAQKVLE